MLSTGSCQCPCSMTTVFLCCLAGVDWLLSKSSLSCWTAPFLVFGERNQTFIGSLKKICAYCYFWQSASSTTSLGYMRQKENPRDIALFSCGSLSQQLFFCFLPTAQSSDVCFIYNVQELQLYLANKHLEIRERFIYFILPEVETLKPVCVQSSS